MNPKIEEIKNQVREVTIGYKNSVPVSKRLTIKSSGDAAEIIRSFYEPDTIGYAEQFHILLMNKANHVLGHKIIGMGSTSSCTVDIKIILQSVFLSNSSAVILVHNHPSGRIIPSEADITLTKKIKEVCKLMDVAVLDHLIIAEENYYSFADFGTL